MSSPTLVLSFSSESIPFMMVFGVFSSSVALCFNAIFVPYASRIWLEKPLVNE